MPDVLFQYSYVISTDPELDSAKLGLSKKSLKSLQPDKDPLEANLAGACQQLYLLVKGQLGAPATSFSLLGLCMTCDSPKPTGIRVYALKQVGIG